ncbi:glycosyltransferase family 4 protein [Synechococcus sp. CS-602]|uniref:glycosyltransferase family 4 protein n=1 Tax=unclassified Synechococcus TaxID=2626047 RepID=UPI0021A2B2B5|nr:MULTISPECIES: glycosyltransferase family 4 protein [unclassified Synechococcus]MCT0203385.1 glycosyltransferase family 4 protein [Synechococcus sp. CS-603]MCT0204033.1 glycosyltransferase family 4 protein [Synechococcus sp. CS-602]
MRILLYIDSLKAGGAERVTLQFAGWLSQAGHEVTVLTRKGPAWDFYPVGADLRRLVERDAARGLGPLGFPWRLLALRQQLRQLRIELAIGMTTLPAIKLLLASCGLGLPVVVSERNYPPAKPPAAPWRLLRRLVYPKAALHLVQTEAIATWLRRQGLARQTACLPNAVAWPLAGFEPRLDPADWLDPAWPVLLAVGTKSHQKGFDRLVGAFARIAADHPSWRLVILGLDAGAYHGVDQVAALRGLLAGGAELQQRLVFPGKAGNVADWYARADLFVLSSRYEGFPNVLLEAMACGCPCLALDCPTGPAEILENGRNGLLLPADAEATQLAAALSRLMGDPQRRGALGEEAREVRERFAPERIQDQFLELLQPFLGGAGGGSTR